MTLRKYVLLFLTWLFVLSCTRNSIEFGDSPESSYTNIVFTDTIGISLSTVINDSFITSNATSLLIGKYKDPYLGMVAAKAFFRMSIPSSLPAIPASAEYDSITFVIKPSDYYYGDTTKNLTLYIHELAQTIVHTYNNSLYNTSNIPVKPVPLGTKTIRLRPIYDDSVEIKLDNALGAALFDKVRNQSTDVTVTDNFLNYFKGISLSVGSNDSSMIFGLNGMNDSMVMRVHYHTTIPYPEKQYVDFRSVANEYTFNQIITDRTGTGIVSGGTGVTEISAAQTNNLSFMQAGTGMYLKLRFPTLQSILSTDKIIKLIKAELILRPAHLSFDRYKYKLPYSLHLAQTDASNIVGNAVLDSTGGGVLYANPVIDDIYGQNNFYSFNITAYINQLLNTPASADDGFFVIKDASLSAMNVDRLVVSNSSHDNQRCALRLSMLIINK